MAEDCHHHRRDLTTLTNDVDGDALTSRDHHRPANGTVTTTGTAGVETYTPNAELLRPDSFTYTVTDGTADRHRHGDGHRHPVNDAPVAVDDANVDHEDTAQRSPATDAVRQRHRRRRHRPPPSPRCPTRPAAPSSAGRRRGDLHPDRELHRPRRLRPTPSPTAPLTDTGHVTVTVTAVNDAPVAVDDTATVAEDSARQRDRRAGQRHRPRRRRHPDRHRGHPAPPTAPWPSPATAPSTYTPAAELRRHRHASPTPSPTAPAVTDTATVTVTVDQPSTTPRSRSTTPPPWPRTRRDHPDRRAGQRHRPRRPAPP